jgi:hypothetical protein
MVSQVGKNYVCTEWKHELITFSEFRERMWSTDSANIAYLAQHPLFDQVMKFPSSFSYVCILLTIFLLGRLTIAFCFTTFGR